VAEPTFSPDKGGTYTIALTVSDGSKTSTPSVTTVTAVDIPRIMATPAGAEFETESLDTELETLVLKNPSVNSLSFTSYSLTGTGTGELSINVDGFPLSMLPFPSTIVGGETHNLNINHNPTTTYEGTTRTVTLRFNWTVSSVPGFVDIPIELTVVPARLKTALKRAGITRCN
jgi:hypothetical protein